MSKINNKNQHRKPTWKTTLKINIKNQHSKNIENVEKTSIFSTWPVVIIDQDALHACIQHITRIHSSEAPDTSGLFYWCLIFAVCD